MKKGVALLALAFLAAACGRTQSVGEQPVVTEVNQSLDANEMETDAGVMSPLEEEEYRTYFSAKAGSEYKFAQTVWNECADKPTGNYTGAACAKSRGMSVMLKTFIQSHMHKCIDQGLAAQGGGKVSSYHIVHAGIFADPRHSPRSLHAENRAIDIKSLQLKLTNGTSRTLVYEGTPNRAFYKAFRNCWGEIVHTYNGCPYASGVVGYTGSIGWENKDHQHHMHTSIPYCVGSSYGDYYYQR